MNIGGAEWIVRKLEGYAPQPFVSAANDVSFTPDFGPVERQIDRDNMQVTSCFITRLGREIS